MFFDSLFRPQKGSAATSALADGTGRFFFRPNADMSFPPAWVVARRFDFEILTSRSAKWRAIGRSERRGERGGTTALAGSRSGGDQETNRPKQSRGGPETPLPFISVFHGGSIFYFFSELWVVVSAKMRVMNILCVAPPRAVESNRRVAGRDARCGLGTNDLPNGRRGKGSGVWAGPRKALVGEDLGWEGFSARRVDKPDPLLTCIFCSFTSSSSPRVPAGFAALMSPGDFSLPVVSYHVRKGFSLREVRWGGWGGV